MSLVLIGINHNTAPLPIRERFAFTQREFEAALSKLKTMALVNEAVILATCNRTELYARLLDHNQGIKGLKNFFLESHQLKEDNWDRYFYILEEVLAIRHLFKVASGLDSQVLGETQILGQVKSAWLAARESGAAGQLLDKLFEKAIEVGRIVRLETKISQGQVSIGSVAIKMLEERFKDLTDKKILIIGAGKIAALISKYIKDKGSRGIFVSSRTYARAQELALTCGGKAIRFEELNQELKEADTVISSTSSPHLVLKKKILAEIMSERNKPLVIMDLALPRDVDPAARGIPGVSLYDLDDLKSVVEENYSKRRKEAKLAEALVQRELDKFIARRTYHHPAPYRFAGK